MSKAFAITTVGALGAAIYFYNINALYSLIAFILFLFCAWSAGRL